MKNENKEIKKIQKQEEKNKLKENKKLSSDIFFLIGLFLLPFENFFFAPSNGWATVTPLLFAAYIALNLGKVLNVKANKDCLYFSIIVVLMNLIAYARLGYNITNIINSLISLGLGFTSYFAMYIYYKKNNSVEKIAKIAFVAYAITLLIGLIEFLTVKFDVQTLYSFFQFVFKRNYLKYDRVQFFFTEPSFVGMHVFGVLLPIFLLSKKKNILALMILYVLIAVLSKSGVRILLDTTVVAGIFILYYILKNKKFLLLILLVAFLAGVFAFAYKTNYRVKQIVDKGLSGDGSLATRYFRIQASVYGYIDDFPNVLWGYGMGNSLIPLKKGYDKAYLTYDCWYMKEVNELGDPNFNDDSVSYCLYIRMISEFGLIIFCFLAFYLLKRFKNSTFKYKWPLLFTILYLYTQFESYAFYSMWILILILNVTKKERDYFE